jgi:Sulfotransferase domain
MRGKGSTEFKPLRQINIMYLALSAGMPRSGSTWLFNAIRLILRQRNHETGDLASCWIADLSKLPMTSQRLVKLHNYHADLSDKAEFVAYSYRDIRDALASSFRKFGTQPTLDLADHYISQHQLWIARADYVMRYEHMQEDPKRELDRIAEALGVEGIDATQIDSELNSLSYESMGHKNGTYNEVTLFHHGHITDGRKGSWHRGLSVALEREIVERHAAWFAANNYSIS